MKASLDKILKATNEIVQENRHLSKRDLCTIYHSRVDDDMEGFYTKGIGYIGVIESIAKSLGIFAVFLVRYIWSLRRLDGPKKMTAVERSKYVIEYRQGDSLAMVGDQPSEFKIINWEDENCDVWRSLVSSVGLFSLVRYVGFLLYNFATVLPVGGVLNAFRELRAIEQYYFYLLITELNNVAESVVFPYENQFRDRLMLYLSRRFGVKAVPVVLTPAFHLYRANMLHTELEFKNIEDLVFKYKCKENAWRYYSNPKSSGNSEKPSKKVIQSCNYDVVELACPNNLEITRHFEVIVDIIAGSVGKPVNLRYHPNIETKCRKRRHVDTVIEGRVLIISSNMTNYGYDNKLLVTYGIKPLSYDPYPFSDIPYFDDLDSLINGIS